MSFTNRISQTLHDEHDATVALMERLQQFLARNRRGGPPSSVAGDVARLLSDLSIGLGTEVERHFAFEENHLFTYLEATGDGGIGAQLTSEHAAIRPLGVRVAEIARLLLPSLSPWRNGRSLYAWARNSSIACPRMCRRKRWRCCR